VRAHQLVDLVCSAHSSHLHVMRRAQSDLLLIEKERMSTAQQRDAIETAQHLPLHKFALNAFAYKNCYQLSFLVQGHTTF
jgi:hypothetical protein